jgi:hypothetical protein
MTNDEWVLRFAAWIGVPHNNRSIPGFCGEPRLEVAEIAELAGIDGRH